jgi:Zn-finger nucleic acid-binding protein
VRRAHPARREQLRTLRRAPRHDRLPFLLRHDLPWFALLSAVRRARRSRSGEATVFNCPRCKDTPALTRINIGKVMLNECGTCEGIWADQFSFEQICTDREQQGAILGPAVRVPLPEPKREKIRYIRCPECNELMQRMNFAGASGVIIDMCPQHGSWFDNKELQQIIAFLRSGGMDRLRQKEIAELNEARRRVEAVRKDQAWNSGPSQRDYEFDLLDVVWAAGSLISHFFRKR